MHSLNLQQSSCLSHFEDTLRYCSPSHGGWGVVRMGMLVPESYQLFVCPFACGRHGAIGAITQGFKDRLSYLYIDETDIVSGGYEQLILEGVEELLDELDFKPKVLMIFVSCLDDLLGTDHDGFLSELRERYQDMRFTLCHMNPITLDSKVPPPVNIQCKIFGLLEKSEEPVCRQMAAFCGNNVAIDKESEIFAVLSAAGYTDILHISQCKTFSEFQQMSRAALNVVPSPMGAAAAGDVKEVLGIDYVYMPVSYDFEEIDQNYHKILSKAGLSMDFSHFRYRTQNAISAARTEVGDMPVVIDNSATVRPFTLAKLLLSFGFNVVEIYAQDCKVFEKESYQWLCNNASDIRILQPEHPRAPAVRRHDRECIAIGFEGAYLTGARYVVNLVNDETLYGYHGIEKLMKMIAAASKGTTDLRLLIRQYGLVV
ncbi:nitrogenase component 1 [Petroclostridium sp. X23]|uniref:nitrogenase component 1 n=1 Tax=Petroclostridium sp. X23 TaxID=3045146 RepID=UPI0024ADAE3C|nr:nitrogenase component 1 [Petroclostridium sp. X23]WHH58725.1 nitrogenase component 1 [Petroclostridium sp. X23]